jgi:protein-S-isoprenylcysteine O-methyltransferase Ste14
VKIILLAYYTGFFLAAFVWPTWRLWQREKINALVLPRDDSAHGLIGRWFKLLIGALLLFISAYAAGLDLAYFGPLSWAQYEVLALAGWLLLAVSLVFIVTAQIQMGRSWRIGIDTEQATDLVTHGLFSRFRNPIFLGMRFNMTGLFFILPCGVTLSTLLLSEALIAVQVRLEEEYLSRILGEAYRKYQQQTPRWI